MGNPVKHIFKIFVDKSTNSLIMNTKSLWGVMSKRKFRLRVFPIGEIKPHYRKELTTNGIKSWRRRHEWDWQ